MTNTSTKLFSEYLMHQTDLPVECLITDTCVGRWIESFYVVENYLNKGVGFWGKYSQDKDNLSIPNNIKEKRLVYGKAT